MATFWLKAQTPLLASRLFLGLRLNRDRVERIVRRVSANSASRRIARISPTTRFLMLRLSA